jgi:dihydroxy-acid dehydratase
MARYRSHRTTQGRTQAAARALRGATGTREEDRDTPVVAIANSSTQFVPGDVRLKPLGELVAEEVTRAGGQPSGDLRPGRPVGGGQDGRLGGDLLMPTSLIKAAGLITSCAPITNGRFSGPTSGLSVGHISPAAGEGGEIGLVEDGDEILIDIPFRRLELLVDEAELAPPCGHARPRGGRLDAGHAQATGVARAPRLRRPGPQRLPRRRPRPVAGGGGRGPDVSSVMKPGRARGEPARAGR